MAFKRLKNIGFYRFDSEFAGLSRFASAIQDEFDNVYRYGGKGEEEFSWDNLTGKPASFPPSSHTHEIFQINGLTAALAAASEPSGITISNQWVGVGNGLNTIGGSSLLTWDGLKFRVTGDIILPETTDPSIVLNHTSQIVTTWNNSGFGLMVVNFGLGAAQFLGVGSVSSAIGLSKSRSNTKGAHVILQNNDRIGDIIFEGSDGAVFRQAAKIRVEVDGTPGSADMPGRLLFMTTPDGSVSPAEVLRLDSAKLATFSGAVTITGATTFNGLVTSNLTFTDATYDIGASAATRPRDYFGSRDVTIGRNAFLPLTTAKFVVGAGSSLAGIVGAAPIQIRTANGNADPDIEIFRFGGSQGGMLSLTRSNGSLDVNSAVSSGDILGRVVFAGAVAGIYLPSSEIRGIVDGTPGSGDFPGALIFYTVPDGGTSLTEAFRLSNNQKALFASTIKTADPSTGQGEWLLGQKKTAGTSSTISLLDYIDVKIDGSLYHVPITTVV